jgi:hypothetical protein
MISSRDSWVETIYIAPGQPGSRVYAMPYPLRRNETPADLLPSEQQDWREVARLDASREVVYIEPGYAAFRASISGQAAGAHFEVTRIA